MEGTECSKPPMTCLTYYAVDCYEFPIRPAQQRGIYENSAPQVALEILHILNRQQNGNDFIIELFKIEEFHEHCNRYGGANC